MERTSTAYALPPADPFDGFFERGGYAPERGGLLDTAHARHWFRRLNDVTRQGLYTFQQPLAGKAGPYVEVKGRRFLLLSTYDYLGLIGHPEIEAAAREAIETYGTGSGGVRLLSGTTALHVRAEEELAAFKGTGAALTFSSGYLANVGAVAALMEPEDRVVVDERAHRSITDACRLARVPLRSFRHNDPDDLERVLACAPGGRRTLVVVEGVYSMDGDLCPLPEIVAAKDRHGAFLMVDEAHAFGVLGGTGRGLAEHFGLEAGCVDLWTGTFSKSVPANGGFVAARKEVVIYLQHGAAPYVFSAALSPASLAAARASLGIMEREPERIRRVHANARRLREGLQGLGFDTGRSESAIVPVLLGDEASAYRAARGLYDRGVLATAVVFPAVARGSARLRLCASAVQTEGVLGEALDAFAALASAGVTR